MKKILILVMSSEKSYYKDLLFASCDTWAKEGVVISFDTPEKESDKIETVFYFGGDMEDVRESKIAPVLTTLHLPVKETLLAVSPKTKMAFWWALKNRDFDYILRANASTYIDKKVLLDYVQDKPLTYFAGLVAPTENGGKFMWGVQYIISRDLVELSVKKQWNLSAMDDRALSLILENEVEFSNGRMITLHVKDGGYEYLTYEEGVGGGGFVKDLSELPQGHYAYRCKQDMDRSLDIKIMKELWKIKKIVC